MNPTNAQDILFDDFALLEKRIGRQQLTAASANANCDCVSHPISIPTHADRRTDQITASVSQAD